MTPTWRADFQAYSLVVVEMAKCRVFQRFADVSIFRLILTTQPAMQSLRLFPGLDLAHFEEFSRSVVYDYRLYVVPLFKETSKICSGTSICHYFFFFFILWSLILWVTSQFWWNELRFLLPINWFSSKQTFDNFDILFPSKVLVSRHWALLTNLLNSLVFSNGVFVKFTYWCRLPLSAKSPILVSHLCRDTNKLQNIRQPLLS